MQLAAPPVMYFPQPQMSDAFNALTNSIIHASWVVRTAADPAAMSDRIRREVAAIDPLQSEFDFVPLNRLLEDSMKVRGFLLVLLTLFACLALLLAAIGVYGVFSYSLQQRTPEVAIRLALGARRDQIVSLFLRRGIFLTLTGLAIGLACASVMARSLTTLLFGIQATDPFTLISSSVALAAVATLATWIPARRAMRVDPNTALRCQ